MVHLNDYQIVFEFCWFSLSYRNEIYAILRYIIYYKLKCKAKYRNCN